MGQNRPADSGPGIRLTDASKGQNNNNAIGYGSDGDSKNSTTRSGINTRNIHITDEAGQLARTGRTAKETEARIYTGIDTETVDQHSGRLKNSFDKDAVAKEINLQREVTQEFGKNAAQTTAAVSDKLGNTQSYERYQAAKTLLEAELQNTDSETEKAAIRASLGQVNAYLAENQSRYDTWKEGGIGRSILHGAAGGLTTGNLGGILAGGGTSLAAPYLDKAAENLGPAGKAAVNALGGAAIGYAAGGSVGTAAVGANVDWNNRQLHDSEIRKIKDNAAKFAKLHPGISQRQAEERLVAQAMRQVDAAYYAKHADTDTAAEQFLRSIAGSFKADGETFLDFAPMKYYRDSGKFANHTGYRDLRAKLGQNPVHTEAQRNRTIEEKAYSTIGSGVGKGIGNTLANNLQAGPPHYVLGITNYSNWGKELILYENPVERAIGKQVEDMTEKAVAAVSLGRSLPSKVVNVPSKLAKSIKTAETHKPLVQKTGEMSVLDGEMAGGNKPRKQTNNVEYGGGNRLATRELVNRNIQETRRRSQSSQFKAHAQRERENKTGLDFNHFIGGDINKKGTVTGGHSLTRGDVRVVEQTSAPDKHGVYQATVEIKKPDGSWEMKKGRSGKPMTNHSMFPKYWDEARIRAEVTSAWEKRKMVNQNKWEGKSSSGVWIEGFITPRGTAYPIYGR